MSVEIVESTDVVPMDELKHMGSLECPYCGKNISKYPMSLQKAVLKSECGPDCYYHLQCFKDLCSEADETDPESLTCMKCGNYLDPADCKYADDLLTGETKLLESKKFYAHPESEGGAKKRKRARKTKEKRKTKKLRKKKQSKKHKKKSKKMRKKTNKKRHRTLHKRRHKKSKRKSTK